MKFNVLGIGNQKKIETFEKQYGRAIIGCGISIIGLAITATNLIEGSNNYAKGTEFYIPDTKDGKEALQELVKHMQQYKED